MSDLTTEKIEEKKIKITYTNGHVKVVAILPHKDTGLYSYVNLTEGHICQCSFASAEEALKDLDNYPNIEKWEFINEWHENSSDDLISRKELIEEISSLRMYITGLRAEKGVLSKYMEEYRKSVVKCIEEAPTAHDVDAVRERIKDIGHNFCISIDCPGECEDCEHRAMMSAIDGVVRNGGKK